MLSGRTMGQLGYIWPTTASGYAIGGSAELALRYSIISASTPGVGRTQLLRLATTGRTGLLDHGQRRRIRRGRRTFQGLRARPEQRTPPLYPPGPQYPSGNMDHKDKLGYSNVSHLS